MPLPPGESTAPHSKQHCDHGQHKGFSQCMQKKGLGGKDQARPINSGQPGSGYDPNRPPHILCSRMVLVLQQAQTVREGSVPPPQYSSTH